MFDAEPDFPSSRFVSEAHDPLKKSVFPLPKWFLDSEHGMELAKDINQFISEGGSLKDATDAAEDCQAIQVLGELLPSGLGCATTSL